MADKHPLTFVPGCNTEPDVIREQFKQNVAIAYYTKHLKTCLPNHSPVAIVCGGPSLNDRWEELKTFPGTIIACNNAYGFLLERGIAANYFMLLDCRKENIEFLKEIDERTHFLIAAQAHPSIYDYLMDKSASIIMYFTNLPDINELIPPDIKEKKVTILGGTVGTVGIKAMSAAHALGFREMHLYGYDSSYKEEKHHAYPQPLNDTVPTIEVFVEDRKYITSASFAHQAQEFPAWAKDLVQFHGCHIELHCDGLLPDLMDYCNRIGEEKTLEEREREKYEEIWNHKNYRKFSPGERLVDDAFKLMGMDEHNTLIDFGCGTGRAANKFKKDYGMQVAGIDHAKNCLDSDVNINVLNACLWNINELCPDISFDWGYCTDVMEHIPTEKVNDVISNISRIVTKGCFFNIATRDDDMGVLIGRKLHMTVANAEAWDRILNKYFSNVARIEKQGEAIFCCFK